MLSRPFLAPFSVFSRRVGLFVCRVKKLFLGLKKCDASFINFRWISTAFIWSKKIQVVVTSISNATHLGACKIYVPIPCNVSTDWHRGRQIQDLLNGTGVMRNVVESYLEEQHSYFYVSLERGSGTCPGFILNSFSFSDSVKHLL